VLAKRFNYCICDHLVERRSGTEKQCFIQTPGLRGEMKGGEGEDAHRATFFCSLEGIIGGRGNSQVLGEKFPPNRSG
jgi:hypothetical protein